jgi:hypothetical protein
MLLLLLALGAAPTAAEANKLASAKQWEELYLAFAAASPDAASKTDRPKIAAALLKGCVALQGDDAVMANSLGEKSVAFNATAEALFCTGITAKRTDQRGAAEDTFRKGLTTFPKDGRFGLELGRLYAEDHQPNEAFKALSAVPPKSKEAVEAKKLLSTLNRDGLPPDDVSSAPGPSALRVETTNLTGQDTSGFRSPTGATPRSTSSSYESVTDADGNRVRQNQYFRIRYFNQKRDFGARADYEGSVQSALEEARTSAQRLLGEARERPCDVILYSRDEFRLHHGAAASQAIAGFYSEDAIRMNDSAEMNSQNQAVLVHEYVHAVMDEIVNFRHGELPVWMHEGTAELIEWRYQGGDGPPLGYKNRLAGMARNKRLPSLSQLRDGPLVGMSDPGTMYALSAMAVRELVARNGMSALVRMMRDCGRGVPFEKALQDHYSLTIQELDERVSDTLAAK